MAAQDRVRPADDAPRALARFPIRILLVIALAIDAYLAFVSLREGSVAGCGPDSNCHTVLSSRWAYWFGVPVSLLGLVVYAALFLGTFLTAQPTAAEQRRKGWQLLVFCAAAVLGAALWFVVVQAFILKAFCPYCMAAHTCASLAAVLVLYAAPIRPAPAKAKQRAQEIYLPPRAAAWLCVAGVASLAGLVAGQTWQHRTTFSSSPISAGMAAEPAAPAVRTYQIFDGQFRFKLKEVPLIGSPEAAHTIVSLFDYTCPHCRELHAPLMEAQERYSNRLSIVSLPVPLDAKCNHWVKRQLAPHVNACALARVGLAVWLANPSASRAYDDWVFNPPLPPQPEEARAYARSLVGASEFDRASTNSWIDDRIREDVAIYAAVYQRYRKGYLPAVIIGTNLLSGIVNGQQLNAMLTAQFGLSPAP